MAASTAPPSSLFSTCWVFPVKGKCAAGSSHWPPPPHLTVVIVARKSGHRCSPICGTRSTTLSAAPRSRFCLSTAVVSIPTLYTIAPTTRGASIRSFCWSGTDRPFRPICSSPSADFSTHCVRFSTLPTTPASSTLRRRPHNSSETKIVGRTLPECADAVVHSQSPRRSISCRL